MDGMRHVLTSMCHAMHAAVGGPGSRPSGRPCSEGASRLSEDEVDGGGEDYEERDSMPTSKLAGVARARKASIAYDAAQATLRARRGTAHGTPTTATERTSTTCTAAACTATTSPTSPAAAAGPPKKKRGVRFAPSTAGGGAKEPSAGATSSPPPARDASPTSPTSARTLSRRRHTLGIAAAATQRFAHEALAQIETTEEQLAAMRRCLTDSARRHAMATRRLQRARRATARETAGEAAGDAHVAGAGNDAGVAAACNGLAQSNHRETRMLSDENFSIADVLQALTEEVDHVRVMLTRLEERLNHATLFAPRRPASSGLRRTTVVNIVAASADGAERASDGPVAGSGVASIRQTFRGLSRATRGAIAANRLAVGGSARRTSSTSTPQHGVTRGRFTTLQAVDDRPSSSADSDESEADSGDSSDVDVGVGVRSSGGGARGGGVRRGRA